MIYGLDDFVNELGREILERAAEALLDDLIDEAPEDTGELKNSAYGPTSVAPLTMVIGFTASQAEWTDKGTIPHTIVPVRARALRFFWENGPNGPDVYTFQQVEHPGVTGTGWFTDMVDNWDEYVDDAAQEI